jgi:hypothetical protein
MSVAGILIGGTFAFIGLGVCAAVRRFFCFVVVAARRGALGRSHSQAAGDIIRSRAPAAPRAPTRFHASPPPRHPQFATAVGIYFAFRGKRLTKDEAQITCTNNIVIWFCAWLMWLCTWLHQWHPIIFPIDVRASDAVVATARRRRVLAAAAAGRVLGAAAAGRRRPLRPPPHSRRASARLPLPAARRWPTPM